MTIAGIMQPYFFPYLGYFGLIRQSDRFIIFDTPQFSRHGWIDRNRILKAGEGWLYIRPALTKVSLGSAIRDVMIDRGQPWQRKLVAQLDGYRRTAPYFRQVRELVEDVIGGDHADLVSLNVATLEGVCRYLGMPRQLEVFSRMDLAIEPATAPDEWALNICRALGIDEYRNPPGGMSFFDPAKYRANGIALRFQIPELPAYDQGRPGFEPGLSVIDALMFNSPEVVVEMMDRFRLTDGLDVGSNAPPPSGVLPC